ncbi:MAG: TonB-dependent receptor [Bacteroides sp.]|nr:TonB-dependent receptor [Bacteroides sp.]
MKKAGLLLLGLSLCMFSFAQEGLVTGKVIDKETGESLIGANVVYGPGKGTITNPEGKFELPLDPGSYELQVSYVGYEAENRKIEVAGKTLILEFRLQSMAIDEVIITADFARARETPVAFTNVSPAKIEEELAGQDIPLILNSTPGVYATQQGGGDGDARITIRGFDQTNLAVMIDGIPVNDMENGWVYWSNWFGLDAVTRTMQVQRGLGASQLALPSVGGTVNILTKGIESKMQTSIKQEVDSQGKLRTSLGFTSGKLRGGWGVTLAGSYKRGNGWVDNTFSEMGFYYGKVDKRFKKHLLTLTAMGAPQMHDQRSYKRPVSAYDSTYAKKIGIDLEELKKDTATYNIFDKGVNYNQHWGYVTRDRNDPNASPETLSERTNQYHKPQFTLRDFWTISDRVTMSNNLYLSIGKGGGDRPYSSIKDTQLFQDSENPEYGQINWQNIYDANSKEGKYSGWPTNPLYSDSLFESKNYMTRAHNEHYWYGLLSKVSYEISSSFKLNGGVDLRSYKGIHYTSVSDLLGGDYAVDKTDSRPDYQADSSYAMKYVGDTIKYYYDGLVRWGGVFLQGEYRKDKLSAFLNATFALSGYNKVDYFVQAESGWIYKPGFTIKAGANYNLGPQSNVFLNLGYLSKVRSYKYFYKGYTTQFADELDNELIKAIEGGYTFSSPRISLFLNLYYTRWENKPTNRVYSTYNLEQGDPGYVPDDPENNDVRVYADIPGMNARHMGVEVDFIYKVLHNLDFQGTASFGDWIWDSYIDDLQFYLNEGDFINEPVNKNISFDARGIHVGDAAQVQLGSSLRYEPIERLYLNVRQTYFTKYYSSFTPEATTDAEGNVHDSWKMPGFNLFDLHAGYGFKFKSAKKLRFDLRFSMLNVLNTTYIWGATNNDPYSPYSEFQSFDARSATVFFGMGRRFSTSLRITF